MGFLEWLMNTWIGQWVGTSCSIWSFPTVLVFHTVGLALLVGTNAIIDLRVLGASQTLPLPELRRLSRVMWIGFAISAMSGIILFMTDAVRRAGQTAFWIKMGLIVVSFVVTYLIRPVLSEERAAAKAGIPRWAKALAVTSLILWAAVIVFGRLLALATL
jgi:hypothetical protein